MNDFLEVYGYRGTSQTRAISILFASELLSSRGQAVTSIRAVFVEGERIFPDSAIFDLAHVQIAVKNPNLIKEVHLVNI